MTTFQLWSLILAVWAAIIAWYILMMYLIGYTATVCYKAGPGRSVKYQLMWIVSVGVIVACFSSVTNWVLNLDVIIR